MPTLALGPIAFTTFEVPARISFGGRQQLQVHTLIGGQRVIDAMGADDSLISWSGVFSGADAVPRARALNALRIAGIEVPLAWDAFLYTVVVSSFTARFERENWIPYDISCVISFDEAAAAVQAAMSVLGSVGLDIRSATELGGLDLSMVGEALALPGASSSGSADAATAWLALADAAASANAALLAAGNSMTAASDVPGVIQAAGQLAQASAARGFILRGLANFNAARG